MEVSLAQLHDDNNCDRSWKVCQLEERQEQKSNCVLVEEFKDSNSTQLGVAKMLIPASKRILPNIFDSVKAGI